ASQMRIPAKVIEKNGKSQIILDSEGYIWGQPRIALDVLDTGSYQTSNAWHVQVHDAIIDYVEQGTEWVNNTGGYSRWGDTITAQMYAVQQAARVAAVQRMYAKYANTAEARDWYITPTITASTNSPTTINITTSSA